MKTAKAMMLAVIAIAIGINYSNAQFTKVVVSLTGAVMSEVDRAPAGVKIEVYDMSNKRVATTRSNSKDGYYFITGLKAGNKYLLKIDDENYLKETIDVNIPNTDKYAEFSNDFLVTPLKPGMKIRLKVPPFELNKTKLRPGAEDFMKKYALTIQSNMTVKIEIRCFPDNGANIENNKKLTEQRCQALKEYFVSKRIDPSRITISNEPTVDPNNPPPPQKRAKGKRYIGSTYIVITAI